MKSPTDVVHRVPLPNPNESIPLRFLSHSLCWRRLRGIVYKPVFRDRTTELLRKGTDVLHATRAWTSSLLYGAITHDFIFVKTFINTVIYPARPYPCPISQQCFDHRKADPFARNAPIRTLLASGILCPRAGAGPGFSTHFCERYFPAPPQRKTNPRDRSRQRYNVAVEALSHRPYFHPKKIRRQKQPKTTRKQKKNRKKKKKKRKSLGSFALIAQLRKNWGRSTIGVPRGIIHSRSACWPGTTSAFVTLAPSLALVRLVGDGPAHSNGVRIWRFVHGRVLAKPA